MIVEVVIAAHSKPDRRELKVMNKHRDQNAQRSPEGEPTRAFMAGGWGTSLDAAAYMRLSIVTLRREIRRGRLRAYRVGGRKLLRLKRDDCDAYLLAHQVAFPIDLGVHNRAVSR